MLEAICCHRAERLDHLPIGTAARCPILLGRGVRVDASETLEARLEEKVLVLVLSVRGH